MDDRTAPTKSAAKPATRKKAAARTAPDEHPSAAAASANDASASTASALPSATDNWTSVAADERGDAVVAAMGLGGVDYMFFNSGSEIMFMQEAIAKANALG